MRKSNVGASLAVLLALASLAMAPQDRGKKPAAQAGHPGVDQRRVDEAIRKGLEFIKGVKEFPLEYKERNVELALFTFVTAGVPETDPKFQELFKETMEEPLTRTYNVSLLAMILEELDRVKYQNKIFHCAQFLLDNQNAEGSWRYGEPTVLPSITGGTPSKDVSTGSKALRQTKPAGPASGLRVKPPVKNRIPVKQNRVGDPDFDKSNSQYAALGLRACHDAGILLPRDLIEKARMFWVNCLVGEEGGEPKPFDKAQGKPGTPKDVATGGSNEVKGWTYREGDHITGSMTAGGIGTVCIYDYILGKPWKNDPAVLASMNWLARHFSVAQNPELNKHHYYYLYALERAGMLYDTDRIGPHDWYKEGALLLLDAQKPDGSWKSEFNKAESVADTCFAILFLKRATRTFFDVASVDPFNKR